MNEVVIRRRVAETTQKLVKGSTDPALTLKNFAEVLAALGDLMSEWTGEVVRVRVTAEGQPDMVDMVKRPAGTGEFH